MFVMNCVFVQHLRVLQEDPAPMTWASSHLNKENLCILPSPLSYPFTPSPRNICPSPLAISKPINSLISYSYFLGLLQNLWLRDWVEVLRTCDILWASTAQLVYGPLWTRLLKVKCNCNYTLLLTLETSNLYLLTCLLYIIWREQLGHSTQNGLWDIIIETFDPRPRLFFCTM